MIFPQEISILKMLPLLVGMLLLGFPSVASTTNMSPEKAMKILGLDPSKKEEDVSEKKHFSGIQTDMQGKVQEKFKEVGQAYDVLNNGLEDYRSSTSSSYTNFSKYSNSFAEEKINTAKKKLNELWESMKKKYEDEAKNMEADFFKMTIVNHTLLQNKEWYEGSVTGKIIESYIKDIQLSMHKIRSSIKRGRSRHNKYKEKIEKLNFYSNKIALERAIKEELVILQHKNRDYLLPLGKACKDQLDYLEQAIQRLPALNTLD